MQAHGSDEKNLASELLMKSKGFFGKRLESAKESLKKKDEHHPATPEGNQADEVIAGIQRFIRSGGADVLSGKQTLALLTKTARHVNAKVREFHRHAADGADADKLENSAALEEITSFFQRLPFIHYKKDPTCEGEEQSEINLEFFPQVHTVQMSGITVIHVKSGDRITHVIMNDHVSFAPNVKVFPNCTEVAIDNCDAENVLRGIGGPVNEIVAARSVFPDSLLQQGRAYFSKLTRLEAVECGWKAIPPLLKDVPHLTALNLSGNQIEAIENLGNCRHLAALDLSHNNLQSVEGLFETSGESCPSALTELDLSHNPLVSLKGLGPWLSNLVSLNLEQCKVSDWLGEINRISRFTTLKSVNLAGSPAYYNLAVGVTSPRQAIIDIMTELTDANDFAIDGVRLSKSEYKSWQVSAGRQKASDSGAQDAEHDESEWPVASGSPPATILLEPETNQPKSVKIVKRRVKSGKSGKNDDNKSGSCDGLQSPVRKGKSGLSKRRVETIDRGVETHRVKKAGVACQATLGAAAGNDFQTEIFQRVQKRIEAPQYRAAHGTALKSWSNGLTLCALLHCCNRSWIDFHNLAPAKSSANVKKAVDVAYAKLGVPKPALGCDFVQDLPQLAAYTALLLIAIQEWEGEQYRKSKQLNERLIAEVERYRVQRQKDKVTLLGEQGNIAAARSLNLSMRPSQDSISSDDNDSTH